LYSLLAILWCFLMGREIHLGPEPPVMHTHGSATPAAAD
jgi:hypothetical protein